MKKILFLGFLLICLVEILAANPSGRYDDPVATMGSTMCFNSSYTPIECPGSSVNAPVYIIVILTKTITLTATPTATPTFTATPSATPTRTATPTVTP